MTKVDHLIARGLFLVLISAGILSGCLQQEPQKTVVLSPEQIVAQSYADSISRELGYFERTIEFLPPNSEHVKLVGNGWITFVWEQQCFMMSDQYHNVAKSAAMMTTMPMDICMRHKDLRTGPTVIIKHENTNSDSTQVVY